MGKSTVVFLPLPGVSHLPPMLEFAERLLRHRHDIAIEVLLLRSPSENNDFASVIATHPKFTFRMITAPELPLPAPKQLSMEKYICDCIQMYSNNVTNALSDIKAEASSQGALVGGLFLDFFFSSIISVADQHSIPSYLFLTTGAGFLRFMQWLPRWDEDGGSFFSFSDKKYQIPGFRNAVPVNALPSPSFNSQGGYATYLSLAKRFNEFKGIIINTFSDLESYALKDISGKGETPPVYPVGPIITFKGHGRPEIEESKGREVMSWLDTQPDSSVVFICFGSVGTFPSSHVGELAEGIERSKCRFLWHLRVPENEKGKTAEEALPLGFMERVKGKGMICGWVKQVEILGHKAIGGFVSHCGWNSTLESVWNGVPQATLPIFAEQRLTAFEMVREVGIAVELKFEDPAEVCLASAEEVERAIVNLMDKDSEARKRVKQMSLAAKRAVAEGGSSFSSLCRFANDIC